MEDLLIQTLDAFGFPIKLQGSLLPDEPYPEHFFTFWNNDSFGKSYYDNEEHSIAYDYEVNFYSTNPEWVYSKLRDAIVELKKAGFIVSGDGHSVISDEPTHDGRGINVLYLRRN